MEVAWLKARGRASQGSDRALKRGLKAKISEVVWGIKWANKKICD